MNNSHGILHRITIAVGLFLGVTATGVGAKASVNQPVSLHHSQQTNHIDQSSVQNNKTTLVNSQGSVDDQVSSLEQKPRVQTNNAQSDVQKRSQRSIQGIGQQTNRLYQRIVASGVGQESRKTSGVSDHRSETYQPQSKRYSMDAESAHRVRRHRHRRYRMSRIHRIYHYGGRIHHSRLRSMGTRRIHHHHSWFRDGLSHRNLRARSWVSMHESSHRWYVLSYGHVCVGYFQLNPRYLGYRHGHIDLRPKHQVKVADRYVRGRYGSWVNAKRFWAAHHWY